MMVKEDSSEEFWHIGGKVVERGTGSGEEGKGIPEAMVYIETNWGEEYKDETDNNGNFFVKIPIPDESLSRGPKFTVYPKKKGYRRYGKTTVTRQDTSVELVMTKVDKNSSSSDGGDNSMGGANQIIENQTINKIENMEKIVNQGDSSLDDGKGSGGGGSKGDKEKPEGEIVLSKDEISLEPGKKEGIIVTVFGTEDSYSVITSGSDNIELDHPKLKKIEPGSNHGEGIKVKADEGEYSDRVKVQFTLLNEEGTRRYDTATLTVVIGDEDGEDEDKEHGYGKININALAWVAGVAIVGMIILFLFGSNFNTLGMVLAWLGAVLYSMNRVIKAKDEMGYVKAFMRTVGLIFMAAGLGLIFGQRPILKLVPLLLLGFGILTFPSVSTVSSGEEEEQYQKGMIMMKTLLGFFLVFFFGYNFFGIFNTSPLLFVALVLIAAGFFIPLPSGFNETNNQIEKQFNKFAKGLGSIGDKLNQRSLPISFKTIMIIIIAGVAVTFVTGALPLGDLSRFINMFIAMIPGFLIILFGLYKGGED